MSGVKVYLCCSIRGGRATSVPYDKLVASVQKYAQVINPFVTNDPTATVEKEREMSDVEIHDRDMKLLEECDVLVAEVTQPSFGVGYEVGRTVINKKPILCLHCADDSKKVSAMITWALAEPSSSLVQLKHYSDEATLDTALASYFNADDSPTKQILKNKEGLNWKSYEPM